MPSDQATALFHPVVAVKEPMGAMLPDVTLSSLFLMGKIFSCVYLICAAIGWTGNFLIILVTIRRKKLRGPCNIFIAVQALTDMLTQLSHIPFAYLTFTEQLVSFRECWTINFVFISASDFSILLMFFIALDRLVAAKRPHLYNAMNPVLYIASVLTLCLIYSITFKIITFFSILEEETLCVLPQATSGWAENLWFGAGAVVNCGVVGVYFVLTRTFKHGSQAEYKRLNRSLNTMIVFYIFGWVTTMIGASLLLVLTPNPTALVTYGLPLATFANVNLAAPFFIYYFRSTLYRNEFRKMLGLKREAQGSTVVHPSAHVSTTRY
uniref:G_PROTEIN_RECEP_F1_2 domain-containing protein n=1 Tax=Steinernema glaseri TaxID=37863 RepID=A0A1I7Z3M8_9BILA